MAKTFISIKKSLGLLDILQFGKYKGCRVDSIVDMDDGYLRYMITTGMKFDASVVDALTVKFSADSIPVDYDPREHQEVLDTYDKFQGITLDVIVFDDIPY